MGNDVHAQVRGDAQGESGGRPAYEGADGGAGENVVGDEHGDSARKGSGLQRTLGTFRPKLECGTS